MKTVLPWLTAHLGLFLTSHAQTAFDWRAFNDYRPSELTHQFATTYDLRNTDEGGSLLDVDTGEFLNATVRVLVEGDGTPDDFGAISAAVNEGSPAYQWFNGFVDIGGPDNPGLPGLRSSTATKLILIFENLDPSKRYNFRGTVARAGGYDDRWSVFGITGAESYVTAHQDGSANQNLFTQATFPSAGLQPHQVALNTGDNKAGSLVGWDAIDPGADGTFEIEAAHYIGVAPFGDPSAGPYGYGFNAIYLAQVPSTGDLRITENPSNQNVPAGQTATFHVSASSPQAITYQWQRAAAGSPEFTDIAAANQSSYTTPVLAAADHGSRYRVKITSAGVDVTTPAAELSVDATIPTLTSVNGSIRFNAVYVSFSEPMKLGMLNAPTNYQLSGGLTINSATALDPQHVRLSTSPQTAGAPYTLTMNDIEDVAGNRIPANSSLSFNAFDVTTNAVGVELWRNITGSAVQNLRDDPRYPDEPDEDYVISSLDSLLLPVLVASDNNTYGGRLRAWLTPGESGEYEFFIRADDQGELRVSVDDSFALFDDPDVVLNELPAASDTLAGDPFQEPGWDNSTSFPIQLEQGRRYALQVLWKEGNGGDHVQVAWRKVGDVTPAEELQPIPGRFLSYYGPSAAVIGRPTITRISLQGNQAIIEWSGNILESSTDLRTWVEEAGAAHPATVAAQGNRFYRAKD
jgi:hypothetical protein